MDKREHHGDCISQLETNDQPFRHRRPPGENTTQVEEYEGQIKKATDEICIKGCVFARVNHLSLEFQETNNQFIDPKMSAKVMISDLYVRHPELPGKVLCKVCDLPVSARRSDLIRHYRAIHNQETNPPLSSEQETIAIKSPFKTKEEYIENIIGITVSFNLPFSFWNCPFVMENQEGHMRHFGITCTANFMSELLTRYATELRIRMKKRLQNR